MKMRLQDRNFSIVQVSMGSMGHRELSEVPLTRRTGWLSRSAWIFTPWRKQLLG
jgi:hypothetical protein